MTLEGDYFGPPAMTKSGLYVDAILGMKFSDPPVIIHLDDGQPGIRLEKGKRYRLRGYETGRYSGEPDDPENPPTKEQLAQRQMAGPYTLRFETRFHVTKAEEVGPAKGVAH